MKINPLLFPDIRFSQYDSSSDKYVERTFYPNVLLGSFSESRSFLLSELPICRLFHEKIRFGGECIFLTGTGSIGKSTNLKILRLYLLKEKIPYYYLNVSEINSYKRSDEFTKENVQKIIALSKGMKQPIVVVLDAYDEIQTNFHDFGKLQMANT